MLPAYAGGSRPWLLIHLSPKHFRDARENFGRERYVGSVMPREIPKSWTYLHEGWNTSARSPVTAAIEAAIAEDTSTVSAVFHLFGSCLKKPSTKNKKKKKQTKEPLSYKLTLPASFDNYAYKIAALVDHYARHQKEEPSVLYGDVQHSPSDRERDHLTRLLNELVAKQKVLSPQDILDQYVKTSDAFDHYKGPGWSKWFLQELERIKLDPSSLSALPPASNATASSNGSSVTI